MKNLLFVINPNSGKRGSKSELISALELFSKEYRVEVYCTQKEMDCFHYIEQYGSQFDVIVVSGGDGTLNEATNAMIQLENKPLLGYIPTGTMNDFSKNFMLTPSFKDTAYKIINGRTDEFDMGKINNRYFNYVAGFGAFTNVSYETERETKESIGDIAYILRALGELPNLHPYHVKMIIDGEEYEKDVMMGLIINGYRVSGFDVVEKDEGIMKDGVFDMILVEWTDNILEWIHYPIGLLNPSITDRFVKRIQASHITIESDDELSWTLDGEKGETGHSFVVDNINKPLKILY